MYKSIIALPKKKVLTTKLNSKKRQGFLFTAKKKCCFCWFLKKKIIFSKAWNDTIRCGRSFVLVSVAAISCICCHYLLLRPERELLFVESNFWCWKWVAQSFRRNPNTFLFKALLLVRSCNGKRFAFVGKFWWRSYEM